MTNLGPRPVAEPALRLSAARAAVLAFLIDAGRPVTVAEVSASSGQHTNTVREHLDALADAELVSSERLPPSGRGRPAIAYAARNRNSVLRGTKEYVALVDALVTQLKRTSHDLEADSMAVGRAWAEDLSVDGTPEEKLRSMGFEPVVEAENQLLLETCPVLAAAKANPEVVCRIHLGLLRTMVGEETDLEPFVENGCRVRLAASSTTEDEPEALSTIGDQR